MNQEAIEIMLCKGVQDDFARLAIPIAEKIMADHMPFAKYHLISNEEFIEEFNMIWTNYVTQN